MSFLRVIQTRFVDALCIVWFLITPQGVQREKFKKKLSAIWGNLHRDVVGVCNHLLRGAKDHK